MFGKQRLSCRIVVRGGSGVELGSVFMALFDVMVTECLCSPAPCMNLHPWGIFKVNNDTEGLLLCVLPRLRPLPCAQQRFKTMETKCERLTFVSFQTSAAQAKQHREGRLPELWPGVNNVPLT